ncbi:MAG: sulfatase-like hydrolase/transferase [Chitinophagales bacterium]|nr:sulfatase-like hydrolase/transferase [Chitinophagales bacterium]MDW8393866.1 sulfatase-like hydrolase/transferase [Chitinophagales bacterium]
MKKSVIAAALCLWMVQTEISLAQCSLGTPTGFSAEPSSCSITYSWNAVVGASGYELRYKLSSASSWTVIDLGNVTSYVLGGLPSNTSYKAKLAARCSNGSSGTSTPSLNSTTSSCSKPQQVSVQNITSSSATVSWLAPCGENSFKLKWRKSGTSSWSTVNNISATSHTLTGLQPQTPYQVKVQSKCGSGNNSSFSKVANFTTLAAAPNVKGKNVLLIIIDDARYDTYDVTGGPTFFPTPNISRIANEGANFRLSFPVLSMCAPSRASIVTGVYPHVHGVTDNPQNNIPDTITLTTLPQILKSYGYYNGLIGKWHISETPQPGYDYWLQCDKKDYFNAKWNYNGVYKKLAPHQTDITTDSAIRFIQRRPKDKPFFLWLGYRVPHTPYVPRSADDGLFDGYDMPIPSNYSKYTTNYPEFLYTCHSAPDTPKLVDNYRGYFELLQGLETRIGDLWNTLQAEGIMDSTLIIFTSDNGYLMGEHDLLEKRLAYEESIKVPLFIRYPPLINAGKVIKKDLALNIDIAPTILDFAGIPQTYGMQGISLLDLMDGTVDRTEMMYQFFNKECVPDIRAVRTLNAKYIMYNCTQTTEEFFDLNNDKKENTNQINNPLYADSVQVYRNKLAFWRAYYGDNSLNPAMTCSLSNVQRLSQEANQSLMLLSVFPNPGSGEQRIHCITGKEGNLILRILNTTGQVMMHQVVEGRREFLLPLDTRGWPAGAYIVSVQQGGHLVQETLIVH